MDNALAAKLSKILNLTKSPVEGEAQAAAAMLQKLLTKHNLELADLEAAGAASAPAVTKERFNGFTRTDGKTGAVHKWKLDLAEVLADHYFCHPLVNQWSKTVAFVGRPDNVEALKMLYQWVMDQLTRLAKSEREEREDRGEKLHAVQWHIYFCEGAVYRLKGRLAELKAQQAADVKTNALVISHKAEISDWLEAQGMSRVDGRMTKAAMEWEAKRAAQKAADEALLAADPERYYRLYPARHPDAIAAALAKQRKEDEAWEKRQAANARRRERLGGGYGRRRSWASQLADELRDEARSNARGAGRKAADKVNLSPFIDKTGAPAPTAGALR